MEGGAKERARLRDANGERPLAMQTNPIAPLKGSSNYVVPTTVKGVIKNDTDLQRAITDYACTKPTKPRGPKNKNASARLGPKKDDS